MSNRSRRQAPSPVSFDVGVTINRLGRPALDCQFAVPKLLGTSASLTADASISSLVAHAFNLGYQLPLSNGWRFTAEAIKQVNDFQYSSSFSEHVMGFGFGWLYGTNHRIGLDAHMRDIHPLVIVQGGPKLVASEQVRRVPLRTIKTSINYKYTRDNIVKRSESNAHPVGGNRFTFACDFSGLFGDVKMAKLESSYQTHRRLWRDFILHSRIGSGAIAQLGGRPMPTPIQDRFFLGGTTDEASTFRGFALRSMGPSGKRILTAGSQVKKGDKLFDHLGGDAYWCFDNAISFPIYSSPDSLDVRGFVFAQIGSLIPTLNARAMGDLRRNVRASVGAGISVPVGGMGTMELSLGKPVLGMQSSDTQQLLQIGIRLSNKI